MMRPTPRWSALFSPLQVRWWQGAQSGQGCNRLVRLVAREGGQMLVFARLVQQPARADRYAGPLIRDAFLSELARSPV